MEYLYLGLANTIQGYAITELAIKKSLKEESERLLYENQVDIEQTKNKLLELEYNSLILDLDLFTSDEEKTVKSIEGIRRSRNVDVYIVASGYNEKSKILSILKGLGYTKIITEQVQGKIRDQFISYVNEKCNYIADEDYIQYRVEFTENLKEENPVLNKLEEKMGNKILTIGIGGCISRIGTTTVAIQMAKALNFDGSNNACVIEANNKKYVDSFISVAEDNSYEILDNDGFRINNVDIYRNIKKINLIKKEEYKYIIYDYGMIDVENDNSIFEKDIVIFVCGYKPNEIVKSTQVTTACIKDYGMTNAFYIYNYVSEEQYEEIMEIQSPLIKKYTFYLTFTPDMFKVQNDNKLMFGRILELALSEEKEKKPSLFKKIFGR